MKKIILPGLLIAPVLLMAQSDFTIKGKVGNLNAPAKAYLFYSNSKAIDSAILKNGVFKLKGSAPAIIQGYVKIKHNNVPDDPNKQIPSDVLPLYLEPGDVVNITTTTDSIKNGVITGSKINEDDIRLKAVLKPVEDKIAALRKEYDVYMKKPGQDKAVLRAQIDKIIAANAEKNPIYKKFAQENRASYIGLTAFKTAMGYDFDPKPTEEDFMKFTPEIRNTALGKRIEGTIEGAKKTQVGTVVADFTQNDPDGKPVKLSDFKGKYVLVDFWASWCAPCRAENPNVLVAYNKYKDKNFTVLGISLDGGTSGKERWLQAVEHDKLTWTQVSDLKGWDNEVSKNFGVQAIPFNFLVGPDGKIVARNITGSKLHAKLAEIFDKETK